MAGSLNQGEILIYQTEKGDTKVDVFLADETVWMTRNNIAALYSTTPQNISRHIKNIYEENELDETATRKQNFLVQLYNDVAYGLLFICAGLGIGYFDDYLTITVHNL